MSRTSRMLERSSVVAIAIALLVGFAPTVAAGDDQQHPPTVGEAYQETIDAAWHEAVAGDDPTMTCARLKGRIAGTGDTDAFRALFACNVDIPVRYFDTYLDQVEAGEHSCQDLMREVMTKLSAMTMSADVVMDMADRIEQGGDTESVVTDAIGDAAAGATEDGGLKHPKRLIKDRIADRTHALCPDFASVIVG
jgi:hypothetical protein